MASDDSHELSEKELPADEERKISLKVNCLECHEDFEYQVVLPTAVTCTNCDSLIDLRLAIHKHAD